MHIWTIFNWEKHYKLDDKSIRTGLRIKFDKDVDLEVKRSCKEFCKWLRENYYFPMRIPIYIKSSPKIKALDGEYVSAIFFAPTDKYEEPYIRISTGEYEKALMKYGKDNEIWER